MTQLIRVLHVEDDPMIAKTLKMSLSYKGFDVTAYDTVTTGLEAFKKGVFDLVLLDVNLPDGNGIELCGKIRALNETLPIIMVTAKLDEATAVSCIEGGADDYIRKPYGVQELAARMQRLLDKRKKSGGVLVFGSLRIDSDKRKAYVGDAYLNLGKREFEILNLLMKKSGDALTRNEILDHLGGEADLYDRTIDSHLSHLRKKLKDAGALDVQIVPIYGIGYRLEAK